MEVIVVSADGRQWRGVASFSGGRNVDSNIFMNRKTVKSEPVSEFSDPN